MTELHPNERIDQLYSQGVKIIQSPEVFSFSIDAVLLAHFATLPKRGKVVDLCAGNGAVGLFVSRRTQAEILLIELQERLAEMAQRSIALNGLEGRMKAYPLDLKDSFSVAAADSCDAVLCNPPYFPLAPNSKKNPNTHLALARHEIATNLSEVAAVAGKLLKTGGHFAMVHRPERLLEILAVLQQNRLTPKRLQFVYPKADRAANTLLIEAIKDGSAEGLKILPPLIVYENGEYSPAVKRMLYGTKGH